MLTGFHLRIAQIIARATGPQGFALGGGYALQAHGVTDRPSEDLDSYTTSLDPRVFEQAEDQLRDAFEQSGMGVRGAPQ